MAKSLLISLATLTHGASVYLTESNFVSRLETNYYFNDFGSFVAGDQGVTNITLSGGTPVFSLAVSTVSGPNNNLYIVSGTLPTGKAMSTTVESTDLLLTFTSGNVTAVGANFFLSDLAENQVAGSLNVTLSDGTVTAITNASTGPVGFAGFTTDPSNTIASVRLHPSSQYVSFDNLYVGSARATNLFRATLTIRPIDSTHVEVSWPLSDVQDVLRSKSNLSGSPWMDVLEIDEPSNGFHHVRINTLGDSRFFQLQRP